MSRLQEAVDRFAGEWLARSGEKPDQDTLFDGTFCRVTGQPFCLCLKLGTGLGAMIDLAGLTCASSGKPVTDESYAWMAEARAERQALKNAPGDAAGGHGARGEPGTGPHEPTETAADRPERGSGR